MSDIEDAIDGIGGPDAKECGRCGQMVSGVHTCTPNRPAEGLSAEAIIDIMLDDIKLAVGGKLSREECVAMIEKYAASQCEGERLRADRAEAQLKDANEVLRNCNHMCGALRKEIARLEALPQSNADLQKAYDDMTGNAGW